MPILAYSLVALGLASSVAGDGWDDFTNNLATDLAPIISLFGEQATKQYLSESLHWIDYFIFAMAPIGILTALVSAIRVCGSPSLKAFIGRARETRGSVEAELLSSTSHDVCELYNNGGITRVFGRPKILEFVHDPNVPDDELTRPGGTAGIWTFQQYARSSQGRDWEPLSSYHDDSDEETAPNLSHNVGIKRLDDVWFRLAAVLGFVLQAGVLVFAGIATYLLRLEKEGSQPPSYACPMVIVGTMMVCGGMFLCAVLVGESTEERIYVRKKTSRQSPAIYRLQPSQILGDQTFDCVCYVDEGDGSFVNHYVSSRRNRSGVSSWSVWFAIFPTLVGFVLQFVGFRGTHSSISMAQLGAALVMSVARAALRTQRLITQKNLFSQAEDNGQLVEGHELDWLAFHIGIKHLEIRQRSTTPSWTFHGMIDSEKRITECEKVASGFASIHRPTVKRILGYRRALAQLTRPEVNGQILSRSFANDMVFVRDMAEKLGQAIESVADIFFSTATMKDSSSNSWSFKCGISFNNDENSMEEIVIHLRRLQNDFGHDQWKLNEDKEHNLEAILGLWVWSLTCNRRPASQRVNHKIRGLRDRVTSFKRRIISLSEDPKDVGFDTWVRGSSVPIPKKDTIAVNANYTSSTIWYHASDSSEVLTPVVTGVFQPGIQYCQLFGWYTGEWHHASPSPHTASTTPRQIWTLPTTCDTLSLCAQEVLGVFVKSILDATSDIGPVVPDSENHCLQSALVSKTIDAVISSGVASKDDAVWCILPQLVVKERSARRTPLWHAASNGYLKVVEFLLDGANVDLELGDLERGRNPLWQAAAKGQVDVVLTLIKHGADAATMDADGTTALAIAAENGHQAVAQVLVHEGNVDPDLKNGTGNTALHVAVTNNHLGVVQVLLDKGADVKLTDESGATPLSLALDSGHAYIMKLLTDRIEDVSFETGGLSWENSEIKFRFAQEYVNSWTSGFRLAQDRISSRNPSRGPVKIAVLCTGVDLNNLPAGFSKRRKIVGRSWVDGPSSYLDTDGSGTKYVSLLLSEAPRAELFVAKFVANESFGPRKVLGAAAKAIEYAIDPEEWNVDILVLPFSLYFPEDADKRLRLALATAHGKGKIILTADTNLDRFGLRGFPANSPYCIAITGLDGYGNNSGISPRPGLRERNFATLGICLPVRLASENVRCSGASFAVGMAAGIVASFLDLVRFETGLDDLEVQRLWSNDGVRDLLLSISSSRDGYEFLTAWGLFGTESMPRSVREIVKRTMWHG